MMVNMVEHINPTTHSSAILMIGNPGTGKSTLLNGLIGQVKFKSGVTLGNGLTTVLHEATDIHGHRFLDTPGLSDIELRKQAAKEIEKALKTGLSLRIFFIVTLQAGRINPDDLTTIKLVLEAAEEIKNNFAIIVNKTSKKVLLLLEKEDEFIKMRTKLNADLPAQTDKIYFHPQIPELEDADDQLPVLSEDFLKFIKKAPVVEVTKEKVKTLQYNEFEKIRETFGKKLDELEKNKQLMENQIRQQTQQFEKFQRGQIFTMLRFEAKRILQTRISMYFENREPEGASLFHDIRDVLMTFNMKDTKFRAYEFVFYQDLKFEVDRRITAIIQEHIIGFMDLGCEEFYAQIAGFQNQKRKEKDKNIKELIQNNNKTLEQTELIEEVLMISEIKPGKESIAVNQPSDQMSLPKFKINSFPATGESALSENDREKFSLWLIPLLPIGLVFGILAAVILPLVPWRRTAVIEDVARKATDHFSKQHPFRERIEIWAFNHFEEILRIIEDSFVGLLDFGNQ